MFKVIIGEKGLPHSWQRAFPKTTECLHCHGKARIGFVVFETYDRDPKAPKKQKFVCNLHPNKGKGGFWPHDCVAVAVYFCKDCLDTSALYNQA